MSREIDELLAVHVVGEPMPEPRDPERCETDGDELPEWSERGAWRERQYFNMDKWEITSVWEACPFSSTGDGMLKVLEAMYERVCDFSLERANTVWYADFKTGQASADTAPMAVALAALRALGVEVTV